MAADERPADPAFPEGQNRGISGYGPQRANQTDHSDFRLRLSIASPLLRWFDWSAVDQGGGAAGSGRRCDRQRARYGQDVLVLESHDRPGGAAHSFDIKGFSFDSGPSLFSGFQSRGPQANPLAQVKCYVIVHSLLSFL